MNTKRQNMINFRLSDDERLALNRKIEEAGMTKQEFLLRTCMGKPVLNKQQLKELFLELRKQGVNLNQISRRLNSNPNFGIGILDRLEENIMQIKKLMEEIWRFLKP